MLLWTDRRSLLLWLLLSLAAQPTHAQPAAQGLALAAALPSVRALRWGLSKHAVQSRLAEQIQANYRLRIAQARDPAEAERLRLAASAQQRQLEDSYVLFNGAATPWDTSFLRGEFSHGRGQAMLVLRDPSARTFYFFVAGKLRKIYLVFDPAAFPEGNFAAFAAQLQRRLGPATAM